MHQPDSFLKDKTVLFVAGDDGAVESYIEDSREYLAERFEDNGYTLLYLPELVGNLEPSLMGYLFPGSEGEPLVGEMYRRIREYAGLDGKSGFLYKKNGQTIFRSLPESPKKEIETGIDIFISSLNREHRAKAIRFRPARRILDEEAIFGPLMEPCGTVPYQKVSKEEPLDERTRKIIAAWEKIESEFGISIQDLDIILGYRVKLSRLNITTAGKITLTDWKDCPEVKMDDLTKAVYFYYLRHPEGCSLKELQDHEEEILHYYMSVTGRDNVQEIRRSVHNFLDPFGNSLNVCISRIKKAFRDIVGDRVARFYYVDGHYAEPRKVAIDRDLVIWSH